MTLLPSEHVLYSWQHVSAILGEQVERELPMQPMQPEQKGQEGQREQEAQEGWERWEQFNGQSWSLDTL